MFSKKFVAYTSAVKVGKTVLSVWESVRVLVLLKLNCLIYDHKFGTAIDLDNSGERATASGPWDMLQRLIFEKIKMAKIKKNRYSGQCKTQPFNF